MKKKFIRSSLIISFAVSVAIGFSGAALDTANAADTISKVPHIMAADNMQAWDSATPTTCRGVRFARVGKSDSPRYIFQNVGIEGLYTGKESTCIPIDNRGMPLATRGVIVDKNSDEWKSAEKTFCTDVRYKRGGSDGDTVYWVFSSRAAVYNDLSTCTKTEGADPFTR